MTKSETKKWHQQSLPKFFQAPGLRTQDLLTDLNQLDSCDNLTRARSIPTNVAE